MTDSIEVRGAAALDAWIGTALAALAPDRRAALFRALALDLRKRTSARMVKQTGPDGKRWRPREPRHGRDSTGQVRRTARMFRGLAKARRLKIASGADGLTVGWRGRDAILAMAHHAGGTGGDRTPVPARPLIGLPAADIALVRAAILDALAGD